MVMDKEKRDLLVDAYVDRIVDRMDIDTLVNYARANLYDVLDDYGDADLVKEISAHYPDMLDLVEEISSHYPDLLED